MFEVFYLRPWGHDSSSLSVSIWTRLLLLAVVDQKLLLRTRFVTPTLTLNQEINDQTRFGFHIHKLEATFGSLCIFSGRVHCMWNKPFRKSTPSEYLHVMKLLNDVLQNPITNPSSKVALIKNTIQVVAPFAKLYALHFTQKKKCFIISPVDVTSFFFFFPLPAQTHVHLFKNC